jgi:hypothetical protein
MNNFNVVTSILLKHVRSDDDDDDDNNNNNNNNTGVVRSL